MDDVMKIVSVDKLFREVVLHGTKEQFMDLIKKYPCCNLGQKWGDKFPNQGDAVIWATYIGNVDVLSKCVKYCDLTYCEKQLKWTALYFAAYTGNCHAVSILMEANVNPNIKDIHDETPLHIASWRGHATVVRLLLAYQVDSTIKNLDRETARDLAIKYNHHACVELFNNSEKCIIF